MLIKLHEAYLLKQCKTTEYNVRKEYRLMRKIMFSWMNQHVRATFSEWAAYSRFKSYWRRRLLADAEGERNLREAAERVDQLYKGWELAKWERMVDPFSDQLYWKHRETGERRSEEPLLEQMVFVPRHAPGQAGLRPRTPLPPQLLDDAARRDNNHSNQLDADRPMQELFATVAAIYV